MTVAEVGGLSALLGSSNMNSESESTYQRLAQLNRFLDEAIKDGDTKLAELRSRAGASDTQILTARIDTLISVLAGDTQASIEATRQNIQLQRDMKRLTIYALIFAVIACILAGGQLYYASRPPSFSPSSSALPPSQKPQQ